MVLRGWFWGRKVSGCRLNIGMAFDERDEESPALPEEFSYAMGDRFRDDFDDRDEFEAWVEARKLLDPVLDALDDVAQARMMMGRAQAAEARALAWAWELVQAELGQSPSPMDLDHAQRSLVAELATQERVSERTMAARLNEAEVVVSRFPATLSALADGYISYGHLRVIVEAGALIEDDAVRRKFEYAVLERAETITPGRLRRLARVAAEELASVTLEERHEKAREARGVEIFDLGDGMSQLTAVLPTILAAAAWDRLTRQAKAVREANTGREAEGEPRTLDQIRADLVAELLLTTEPSGDPDAPHCPANGIRAEVSIVIPVLTLLDKGSEPATIAGSGPIDLETAKRLAGDAPQWLRVLTDPITDQVLTVDTYRPSMALRRFVKARDGRCRHPSCNRSPDRCDLDHTIEYQHGGKTTAANLACMCRGITL